MKKHAQTWHMIGANVSVTDAIQNGHKIILIYMSKIAKFSNHHSSLSNANFFAEVVELLKTERTKITRDPPSIVNQLLLSINNSDHFHKISLGLRYVNIHVPKDKILCKNALNQLTFYSNLIEVKTVTILISMSNTKSIYVFYENSKDNPCILFLRHCL